MDLDDDELKATRKAKGLEKTADEMFEELRYKKAEYTIKHPGEPYVTWSGKRSYTEDWYEDIIAYCDDYNNVEYHEIEFNINDRTILKGKRNWRCDYYDNFHFDSITIKELQAINKKCEELGWM